MISRAATENSLVRTLSDYYELTKPGITFTVVASMLVGFIMGTAGAVNYSLMAHALFGTYLIAAGTAAHNMYLEWGFDGLMHRTSNRPLPDQRLDERSVLLFSLGLIFSGFFYLFLMVNVAAGLISLATAVIYLWAYTPLKRISALNVFVGAIPGALPPVGGWAAASGTILEHGMWILFGILFCWQIPHVMSIAWVCKKDYQHAGFQMLPKRDRNGLITTIWIIIPLMILFPTVYKLYVMDLAGLIFLIGSLFATAAFFYYGILFSIHRSHSTARALMFSSFIYIPLVWIFLFLDWMV